MRTAWVVLRQLALAVTVTLLFWGVIVPRACGDTIIPLDGVTVCPPGHRYEPLRLAGPRWVGLCYQGKDARAALARAGWTDVETTLDDSVEGRGVDVCMTCSIEEDILMELIELNSWNRYRYYQRGIR